jgi:Na+/proline symporter
MAAAPSSALIPVLISDRYVGCLLDRGKLGHEAFNAAERSLGTFASAAEAVAALIAAASEPPEAV